MTKAQANLDSLRISQREIDELTGLDVSGTAMGWAYRQTALRPEGRMAWLGSQLMTLGVVMVLFLPAVLIAVRSISGDDERVIWVALPVGILGAIALTMAWAFYRLRIGKQLIMLSHLLDEVDRFNEMVSAVEILEELANKGSRLNLENRKDVLEAMYLTRESLICGLMTERVLRKHQQFMARRQEMFSSIERNLATLQQLQVSDEATDYGRLLNEAIQIGTSVHRELSESEKR